MQRFFQLTTGFVNYKKKLERRNKNHLKKVFMLQFIIETFRILLNNNNILNRGSLGGFK